MVAVIKNNLFSLYIIKIVFWFLLIMPVIVPFYYHFGLSTSQIFIIQAAYSLSMVLFEIPSGYIADRFGRKNSILTGAVLGFLGYLLYCFSGGFWEFMIAEIILGIGQSMISGADSALLYDTLKSGNTEGDYIKYEGRMSSFGNFAESIGGICGSLLAVIAIKMPFYIQCSLVFFAIPAAMFLKEPTMYTVHKTNLKDIFRIVRYTLHDNKRLRENALFSAIMGAATLSMAWLAQPFFLSVAIPIALFGVLWAVLNFSVGLSSFYAFKIAKNKTQTIVLWSIAILIPFFYVFLGIFVSQWALVGLLAFYLLRGFVHPVLKDYIHNETPSEMRATVLSIRNFIIRIVFSITGPIIGYMTDKLSLGNTLIWAGVFYFVSSALVLLWHRNDRKK